VEVIALTDNLQCPLVLCLIWFPHQTNPDCWSWSFNWN